MNVQNTSEKSREKNPLWVTRCKFDKFKKTKSGQDALILYFFLQDQALKQGVSVRADNIFIAEELSWAEKRVKRAKSYLRRIGLIEMSKPRTERGTFKEVRYILVKNKKLEVDERQFEIEKTTGAKNAPLDNSPQGSKTTRVDSSDIPKHKGAKKPPFMASSTRQRLKDFLRLARINHELDRDIVCKKADELLDLMDRGAF